MEICCSFAGEKKMNSKLNRINKKTKNYEQT